MYVLPMTVFAHSHTYRHSVNHIYVIDPSVRRNHDLAGAGFDHLYCLASGNLVFIPSEFLFSLTGYGGIFTLGIATLSVMFFSPEILFVEGNDYV